MTPCSVNAPDTTGFFVFVRIMYRRHASDTWASMSSLVEKAVARYGMLWSPSPTRTYSTKSVEFARRVSPVRWSRTFRPDEPGHEVDAVAAQVRVRVAVAVVEREGLRGVGDRPFDDLAREQDPAVGV